MGGRWLCGCVPCLQPTVVRSVAAACCRVLCAPLLSDVQLGSKLAKGAMRSGKEEAQRATRLPPRTSICRHPPSHAHLSTVSPALQYGHVLRSRIHAADWCIYLKGGSSYFVVAENTIFDCGSSGFAAGEGVQYMLQRAPPWAAGVHAAAPACSSLARSHAALHARCPCSSHPACRGEPWPAIN